MSATILMNIVGHVPFQFLMRQFPPTCDTDVFLPLKKKKIKINF